MPYQFIKSRVSTMQKFSTVLYYDWRTHFFSSLWVMHTTFFRILCYRRWLLLLSYVHRIPIWFFLRFWHLRQSVTQCQNSFVELQPLCFFLQNKNHSHYNNLTEVNLNYTELDENIWVFITRNCPAYRFRMFNSSCLLGATEWKNYCY